MPIIRREVKGDVEIEEHLDYQCPGQPVQTKEHGVRFVNPHWCDLKLKLWMPDKEKGKPMNQVKRVLICPDGHLMRPRLQVRERYEIQLPKG